MQRAYLMLFVFLLLAEVTECQSNKEKYRDKFEPNSKVISCTYSTSIEKIANDKYVFKRYYPDTRQITQYATFDSKKLKNFNGLYQEFWDDGTLVTRGVYLNNLKQGEWLEFRNMKGPYRDGLKHGLWVRELNDSIVLSKSFYINNELHGNNIIYDSLGVELYTETYEYGQLIHTTRDSSTIVKEELPRFSGCEDSGLQQEELLDCSNEKLLYYVYSNLRYPAVARREGVSGLALAEFTVKKDGHVSDLILRNALCDEIKTEITRIISEMPRWRPGYQNGKPVNVKYYLPIKFRLE